MNTPFLICEKQDIFYSLLLPVDKLACSDPILKVFLPEEDIVTITLSTKDILKLHVESGLRTGEVDFHFFNFPVGTWSLGIYGTQNGYLTEVSYELSMEPLHTPEPSTGILLLIGFALASFGKLRSKMRKKMASA